MYKLCFPRRVLIEGTFWRGKLPSCHERPYLLCNCDSRYLSKLEDGRLDRQLVTSRVSIRSIHRRSKFKICSVYFQFLSWIQFMGSGIWGFLLKCFFNFVKLILISSQDLPSWNWKFEKKNLWSYRWYFLFNSVTQSQYLLWLE